MSKAATLTRRSADRPALRLVTTGPWVDELHPQWCNFDSPGCGVHLSDTTPVAATAGGWAHTENGALFPTVSAGAALDDGAVGSLYLLVNDPLTDSYPETVDWAELYVSTGDAERITKALGAAIAFGDDTEQVAIVGRHGDEVTVAVHADGANGTITLTIEHQSGAKIQPTMRTSEAAELCDAIDAALDMVRTPAPYRTNAAAAA